ncbi:MAG: LamG domain-containing protein [Candidatus Micrarchaeaceae archaeon]
MYIHNSNAQISLEFIIIYSLVMIIFLILFALVSTQRATALQAQESSYLELYAQNVAYDITYAEAAGNGYTATLPLLSELNNLPVSLYISSTGFIIAKANIGQQVLSAQASTSAREMVINGTPTYSNTNMTIYQLPTYSGSLSVSNHYGVIYIDTVPKMAFLPSSFTYSSQSGKVAAFNGNSYIISSIPVNVVSAGTITLWIKPNVVTAGTETMLSGNLGLSPIMIYLYNGKLVAAIGSSSNPQVLASTYTVPANTLSFIALTYNSTTAQIYVNSTKVYSASAAYSGSLFTPIIGAALKGYGIFAKGSWNGIISNVQIYNSSLSQNAIISIYKRGIFAPPTNSSLVAWYPLNGNANDYSGSNNNATSYNVTYMQFTGLSINVLPKSIGSNGIYGGAYLSNSFYGSTSSNASAFNYLLYYPNASQKLYLDIYNGNATKYLVSWLPLNFNSSASAYEFIHGNNGFFQNQKWSNMSKSVSFLALASSSTSKINEIFKQNFITSGLTIIAWVYWKGGSYMQNSAEVYSLTSQSTFAIGVNGISTQPFARFGFTANSLSYQASGGNIAKGAWYMIAGTWNGASKQISIYLNGKLYSTIQASTTSPIILNGINITSPFSGISAFNGSLANIQLYAMQLSQQQISNIYGAGISSPPLENYNLIGWWPMSGSIRDFSNYSNSGTSNNIAFSPSSFIYATSLQVANFSNSGSIFASNIPSGILPANYSVSQWFMLHSEVASSSAVNGGQSPIVDLYNASSNGGVGSGQNYDFGGSWAGGTAENFAWGENWPVNWVMCSTPSYSIMPNSWYNAVVTVKNFNNVTIYINGYKEKNCLLSISYSTAQQYVKKLMLSVGSNPPGGLELANACVTNVQVFNYTLNPAQAMQLYSEGLPMYSNINIP